MFKIKTLNQFMLAQFLPQMSTFPNLPYLCQILNYRGLTVLYSQSYHFIAPEIHGLLTTCSTSLLEFLEYFRDRTEKSKKLLTEQNLNLGPWKPLSYALYHLSQFYGILKQLLMQSHFFKLNLLSAAAILFPRHFFSPMMSFVSFCCSDVQQKRHFLAFVSKNLSFRES